MSKSNNKCNYEKLLGNSLPKFASYEVDNQNNKRETGIKCILFLT